MYYMGDPGQWSRFLDDLKITIDFTGPDMSFPQSYLIDILNNV